MTAVHKFHIARVPGTPTRRPCQALENGWFFYIGADELLLPRARPARLAATRFHRTRRVHRREQKSSPPMPADFAREIEDEWTARPVTSLTLAQDSAAGLTAAVGCRHMVLRQSRRLIRARATSGRCGSGRKLGCAERLCAVDGRKA